MMPFSAAASMTPKRSAKMASTPAAICASAASLALGGSKNEPMKVTLHLTVRIDVLGALAEGVDQTVDLGNVHRRDRTDDVRLGHLAGDHAGQIGRLMNPVVEDREIRLRRSLAGAEDEGHLGEFPGNPPGDVLGRKGVAGDQLIAVAGEFAQHTGIVGRGDVFGPFVFDAHLLLRLEQRHVDLVVPGLFDGRREDRGDLHRVCG